MSLYFLRISGADSTALRSVGLMISCNAPFINEVIFYRIFAFLDYGDLACTNHHSFYTSACVFSFSSSIYISSFKTQFCIINYLIHNLLTQLFLTFLVIFSSEDVESLIALLLTIWYFFYAYCLCFFCLFFLLGFLKTIHLNRDFFLIQTIEFVQSISF